MGRRCCRFAGYPGDHTNPRGQKGTVKMSGCIKLSSVCAADATGPISRDVGERSTGVTPRLRGTLLPHPARGRTEGEYGEGRPWNATKEILLGEQFVVV
jgi:hypothetical protein